MNEAEDILVGVTEAHSTTDVYHSVDLVVRSIDIENRKETVPCFTELCKTCCYLFRSIVLLDHCISLFLVEYPGLSCEEVSGLFRSELLILRILSIAEDIDKSL